MSEPSSSTPEPEEQAGLGAAVQEVSDRAVRLVQEEVALAKAELSEKFSKLVKGVVITAVVAVFLFWAIALALFGFAFLAYDLGLGSNGAFQWGFFLVAFVLVILSVIGGLLAFKAFKAVGPPVPTQAIEEAQNIRSVLVPEDSTLPYDPPVYKAAEPERDRSKPYEQPPREES